MITQVKGTNDHNDKMVAKKIQELKKNGVPGKSTRFKVQYLMEHYPYLKPKEMAEILGVTGASIHSARYLLLKDEKEGKKETPIKKKEETEFSYDTLLKNKDFSIDSTENAVDPLEGITVNGNEQHIDIWDEQNRDFYTPKEPPYIYRQPIEAETPQTSYEINLMSVDGMTVQQFVDILNKKIIEHKKYHVHFKIEEV